MPRFFLLIIFISSLQFTSAQTVHGSWYGRADVNIAGSNSNYLTELVLKQKGDEVEGIFGYYFKDSYQSFFIRGTYNAGTRQVNIRNLPMLFYGATTRNGIECPMHFQGTLMVSKVNSTLRGIFYTDPKYKYTCPELTVNMNLDNSVKSTDSALKNTVTGKKFWSPREEDLVISGYSVPRQEDTSGKRFTTLAASNAQPNPDAKLIEAFNQRNNIYEKDIIVYDDSILVSFYDNGDIDDDTISVFLNRKPVLIKRGLTARALNIYIGLDSTTDVHELSMFADNLGKFPPNTALMVISDRQKRYELYLSASLKQNASVRLRRPYRR